MLQDMDTIDKAAMFVSTGLMFVGIVVLGIVETVDGAPEGAPASAEPITNEAGEVVATPGLDPNLRTVFVVAALVVMLLYAVYKLATPVEEAGVTTPADSPPQ
jgi:hypothetical protein